MKAEDIVKQLWTYVPTFTDKFTDTLSVSAITSSGLVANIETSTPHGLSTDDFVNVSGTLVPNDINVLTSVDGIASAETALDHDLTEGKAAGVGLRDFTVNIIDANEAAYNGEHKLLTVPNRRNFTFEISGSPPTPATGSPKLLEDLKYGYNGWHQITKVDDTNFTYAISKVLGSPAYGTPLVRANPRISAAVSAERVNAAYTEKGADKLWGFVVLGNRSANKDRRAMSDATATPGKGDSFRQLIIQSFNIYVFFPSVEEIAARAVRDSCEDILKVFSSSIISDFPQSVFTEQPFSKIIYTGDSFVNYEKAYYVHSFSFEISEYITYPDIVNPGLGVAFRDVDVDYLSSFSDNSFMTDKIDLDDEPL